MSILHTFIDLGVQIIIFIYFLLLQVVQWLEQEFSASLNTRTTTGVQEVLINAKTHRSKSKSAAFAPEVPPVPSAAQAPNTSAGSSSRPTNDDEPSPSGSDVKQHEHHHVHEHIHHHYHHYQENPPVLV